MNPSSGTCKFLRPRKLIGGEETANGEALPSQSSDSHRAADGTIPFSTSTSSSSVGLELRNATFSSKSVEGGNGAGLELLRIE